MKNVSVKEFIWYAACGIIIAFGLICMIFGIAGYHMAGTTNFVTDFEEKIKLPLRFWGIIFMAFGVILSIIVLLFNAKKADRELEKKLRREQRLAAQADTTIEVKNAVEFVEETPTQEKAETEAK